MPADQALVATAPTLKRQGQAEQRLTAALLAATITQPAEGLDHVELEFANWGSGDGGDSTYALLDIALGDALEVAFGATPVTVFRGEVTAIEERYGEGAPKLVLLAEDKLHRLARNQRSKVFTETSIDDIISSVAQAGGLQADVQVSSAALTVHQLDESDLALLRRLVRPFGIPLRLVGGTTLRAKPAEADTPVVIDARDNGHRVRITADLARQQRDVTVAGYNLPGGEAVEENCDQLQPAPAGRSAADHLQDLGWGASARLPWPVGLSSGHARDLARGGLARQAGAFLRGDVVCEGDPRLAPGASVRLDGVSPRLAGTYGVVAAVHRFDRDHGYECWLAVARPDWTP